MATSGQCQYVGTKPGSEESRQSCKTFLLQQNRIRCSGLRRFARESAWTYLPEARVGDYVLVHAGFALTLRRLPKIFRTAILKRSASVTLRSLVARLLYRNTCSSR